MADMERPEEKVKQVSNLVELEKDMKNLIKEAEDTENRIRGLYNQVEGRPQEVPQDKSCEKEPEKANRILRLSDKVDHIRARLHAIKINIDLLRDIIGE